MLMTSCQSCFQAYRKNTRQMEPTTVLDLLVEVETNVSGLNQITVGVPRQQHTLVNACNVVNDDFKCSWTHKLTYLGPDYFPSLVIETECAECDFFCRQDQRRNGASTPCDIRTNTGPLRLLKRTQRDGYDDWVIDNHPDHFNVGCNCAPAKS